MSKQITKAIIDSIVQKALNTANAAIAPKKKKQKKKTPEMMSLLNTSSRNNSNSSVANVATSQQNKYHSPKYIKSSSSSCRIAHEELIANINGTETFTVGHTFPINPGQQGVFPWLSSQARSWEKYRFISCSFHYVTRTGTSTVGSVTLVPDYDPSDPAPTSELTAATYQGYMEDAPWKNQTVILSKKELSETKLIRDNVVGSQMSLNDYDIGNLFVATSDNGGGPNPLWGRLYVRYDVELSVPLLNREVQVNPMTFNLSGALTVAAPFGPLEEYNSAFSVITFISNGAKTITFNNLVTGKGYFVSIQIDGTGFGGHAATTTTGVGGGTGAFAGADILNGTTNVVYTQWFLATTTSASFTFTYTGTTVTFTQFSIMPMNFTSGVV